MRAINFVRCFRLIHTFRCDQLNCIAVLDRGKNENITKSNLVINILPQHPIGLCHCLFFEFECQIQVAMCYVKIGS